MKKIYICTGCILNCVKECTMQLLHNHEINNLKKYVNIINLNANYLIT